MVYGVCEMVYCFDLQVINVASDGDATLLEVQEIASTVSVAVDSEANIIFGSSIDPELNGKIRVTLIVTGLIPSHSFRFSFSLF